MKAVIEVELDGTAIQTATRELVISALRATNGSTSKAAQMLGCSVRKIQYSLRAWGLKSESYRSEPPPVTPEAAG